MSNKASSTFLNFESVWIGVSVLQCILMRGENNFIEHYQNDVAISTSSLQLNCKKLKIYSNVLLHNESSSTEILEQLHIQVSSPGHA